jgi:hypothetical protein
MFRTHIFVYSHVSVFYGNDQRAGRHTVCTRRVGHCLPCVISLISVFCVHFVIYQQLQQLGSPEPRSWSAPWQGRRYSTPWQAIRCAHHSTNQRLVQISASTLLQLDSAGRRVGTTLYGFRYLCKWRHSLFCVRKPRHTAPALSM